MKWTEENKRLGGEAEKRALADYEAVAGRIIVTSEGSGVTGYNERGDSVEVYGCFHVRVDKGMKPDSGLTHWCDEHLDPYWDVTPVKDYPELRGLDSFWTFGRSYEIRDGKIIPDEEIKPLTFFQSIMLRLEHTTHHN